MQFHGKLNEAEVKEATRFVRPKGYNARMAVSYIRLVVYAIIAIGVVWASVVQHRHIAPALVWSRLAILALLGGFAYYRNRKGSLEAVAQLDASLPDLLVLSPQGVQLDGPNGAQAFQPWANYTGFREGQHVAVLQRREKGLYNVLPISALGEGERQSLRGMLASYLPEAGK